MPVDAIDIDLRASVLEEIERDLEGVRRDLEDIIISEAPMATGELRHSIHVDEWRLEGTTFVTLAHADAPQALFTDEGTGIYGPTGSRIYPTNSSALVFDWHGVTVAFASVAGQPAQHWFSEPMDRYYDVALERFGQ